MPKERQPATAIRIFHQRNQELVALCKRFRVAKLEVFGSAATGQGFDTKSDIDFLVEFLPLEEDAHARVYFEFKDELSTLFERPVDLVMTRAIRNKYFLRGIAPSRTLLYAA